MNIAIDVDGVLADFTKSFVTVINKCYPHLKLPTNYQPNDWHYSEVLKSEELKYAFGECLKISDFCLLHDPLPGLQDYIDKQEQLAKLDVSTYFVSHRPRTEGRSTLLQTNFWLMFKEVNMDHGSVIIVPTSDAKVEIYKTLDIKYSIDDRPETVQACEKLPNHQSYLLTQRWNQQTQVINRVDTVAEFLDDVIAVYKDIDG